MGCGFICENDRVYENIVSDYSPQIDSASEEYIGGKYLFRTFAANAAIVGVGIQNKLDESSFNEFQVILKSTCILGNEALPDSKIYKRMNEQPGYQVPKIPLPMILSKGNKGAEFMDKTWTAFTEYCAGQEYASETLVDLYFQALSYPIEGLTKESISIKAMGMFAALRNTVMGRI